MTFADAERLAEKVIPCYTRVLGKPRMLLKLTQFMQIYTSNFVSLQIEDIS